MRILLRFYVLVLFLVLLVEKKYTWTTITTKILSTKHLNQRIVIKRKNPTIPWNRRWRQTKANPSLMMIRNGQQELFVYSRLHQSTTIIEKVAAIVRSFDPKAKTTMQFLLSSSSSDELEIKFSSKIATITYTKPTTMDSLMDMDIVLYEENYVAAQGFDTSSKQDSSALKLGAVQEDGTIVELSAWTSEPVFGTMMEFVVDEHDREPSAFFTTSLKVSNNMDNNEIVHVFEQSVISYGSRQVGGGKGPGNPHGEESELLYYIDQNAIPSNVNIKIKPELEILW
jgi:hypothetical protein